MIALGQIYRADLARDEVLKMTGILHDEFVGLIGNDERNLTSTVAPAAALMNLDVEFATALDRNPSRLDRSVFTQKPTVFLCGLFSY